MIKVIKIPEKTEGKINTIFSDRGIPLVCQVFPDEDFDPIVTVELYQKWYKLFILFPDKTIKSFVPTDVDFCDDCYEPISLIERCEKENFYIDPNSLDMVSGRWFNLKNNL